MADPRSVLRALISDKLNDWWSAKFLDYWPDWDAATDQIMELFAEADFGWTFGEGGWVTGQYVTVRTKTTPHSPSPAARRLLASLDRLPEEPADDV